MIVTKLEESSRTTRLGRSLLQRRTWYSEAPADETSADETSAETKDTNRPSPDPVPYWRFRAVNDERKLAQDQVKALQQELAKYKQAEVDAENAKRIEAGEFAEVLAERNEHIAELEPLAGRIAELESTLTILLGRRLEHVPEHVRAAATGRPVEWQLNFLEEHAHEWERPPAPQTDAGRRGERASKNTLHQRAGKMRF